MGNTIRKFALFGSIFLAGAGGYFISEKQWSKKHIEILKELQDERKAVTDFNSKNESLEKSLEDFSRKHARLQGQFSDLEHMYDDVKVEYDDLYKSSYGKNIEGPIPFPLAENDTGKFNYSTAFRYWLDGARNNIQNGKIAPDEFMGRDSRFKLSEEKQLCFGIRVKDHKDHTIHFILYDPESIQVMRSSSRIKYDDYVDWVKFDVDTLKDKCKTSGNYTVVWEVSDKQNPSTTYKVDEYTVFLDQ